MKVKYKINVTLQKCLPTDPCGKEADKLAQSPRQDSGDILSRLGQVDAGELQARAHT